MKLVPSSKDQLSGSGFEENLALVEMIIGDNSRAISILARLLQTSYGGWLYSPTPITPALLKLDPIWEPIAQRSRFPKALPGTQSSLIRLSLLRMSRPGCPFH
jgi:hypothetical protein